MITGRKATEKVFAMVIAGIMALTLFSGMPCVSHAASVTGAKAVNTGFRMVQVTWKAVKVEIPQEKQDSLSVSGESVLMEESADTEEAPADLNEEPTDLNEDSADPIEEAADPDEEAAEQGAEPEKLDEELTEPMLQSGSEEDNAVDLTDDDTVCLTDTEMDPVVSLSEETVQKPVYDVITYKVYRATSKYGKYKLMWTTKGTSYTNTGLTTGKTYYYKVIAYRSNGKQYGSSAVVSAKVAKHITANMTLLLKGNAAFNYRIAANQKLYKYDTLQGACANGNYAYLTLYNRRVEKCKIVKVKLSNLSVVKVSAALPIYHGNNLTYNTKKGLIAATCCTTNKKAKNRVVMISPQTLKVVSTKDIKLTKKVKNLPKKVRKKNKGFTAIAYNEKHNCYVGRLRKNDNVVILDKNLKPQKYVVLKGKKTWLLAQGIETYGNYIYDVRSFKGRYKYSMVTVHTMSGKYVGQIKVPFGPAPGNELQCIFHVGKRFYAGIYHASSQTNDTKKNHVNRVNLIYRLNNL